MVHQRDIAPLLAVARADGEWTVRSLAAALDAAPVSVQRSLQRLFAVDLVSRTTRTVNVAILDEFIRHGIRFVAPGVIGAPARGVATAWGAEPLRSLLWVDENDALPVWPSEHGDVRGHAVEPVAANAAQLADYAPEIAEDLALIDAIRVGRARERSLAADLLMQRLAGVNA